MLSTVYTCVNNCWMFAGYIQTEIRRASIIFVLKEGTRARVGKCEAWSRIMCLVMIDMSETLLRTRVLNLHMQNRFLFPLFPISRLMGDSVQHRVTSSSEVHDEWIFSVYFLRSLLDGLNAWVCHPHREVNISISVFVAAVEVTTKCSMQLILSISSTPRTRVVERGLPSAFALRPMNIC